MNAESISNVSLETERQIHQILAYNRIEDLKRFLKKRQCLNVSNQYLNYLYNFIQATAIIITSVGQSYQSPFCIWSGVGLSSLAGVIHHIENSNSKISKILFNNIKQIKMNNYIDESIIEFENENEKFKKKSMSNLNSSGSSSGSSSII